MLVQNGGAKATMAMDETTGPSAARPPSLKVSIRIGRRRQCGGRANDGYWGIAVFANTTYNVRSMPKRDGDSPGRSQSRSLVTTPAQCLRQASVPALTAEWQQYKLALQTGTVASVRAENHFELAASHPGQSGSTWFLCLPADLPQPRKWKPY